MEGIPQEAVTRADVPPAGGAPIVGTVSDGWAPLDDALRAYRAGDRDAVLVMRTDVGGEEDVPVRLFFREPDGLPEVEREALARCAGRVLDVGAGVGALAVPLVERGHPVSATEILPTARALLHERGVPVVDDGGGVAADRWDTILLMMNGVGLAGTLAAVPGLLERLARRLAPGGTILLDSTDPSGWDTDDDGRPAGEVHMQLGFGGRWGPPFPFVFLAPGTLTRCAADVALIAEVVASQADGRYLMQLRRAD